MQITKPTTDGNESIEKSGYALKTLPPPQKLASVRVRTPTLRTCTPNPHDSPPYKENTHTSLHGCQVNGHIFLSFGCQGKEKQVEKCTSCSHASSKF